MRTFIIGSLIGDIITGLFITENIGVTIGIFLGQVYMFFGLKVLGYLKAQD